MGNDIYTYLCNFYAYILPPAPAYALAVFNNGKSYPDHKVCSSIQELVHATLAEQNNVNTQLYYGMSGFAQGWYQTLNKKGEVKCSFRTQENVHSVKSFWIDIDVGPEEPRKPPKYPDKATAWTAFLAFMETTKLPVPLIIESLNGYHCYWVLEQALPVSEWRPIATAFKDCIRKHGFKVDMAVVTDPARVLRPPYTYNRKEGNAYLVQPLNAFQPYINLEAFKHAIGMDGGRSLLDQLFSSIGATPNTITVHNSEGYYDAWTIVKGCPHVANCGVRDYNYWFAATSILSKCGNGREVFHSLSAQDNRYDFDQTEAMFDSAVGYDHAPTLCASYNEMSPGVCDTCPFRNTIKSPLHLKISPNEDVQSTAFPDVVLKGLSNPNLAEFRVVFEGVDTGVWATEYKTVKVGSQVTSSANEVYVLEQVLLPLQKVEGANGSSILYWRELQKNGAVRDHKLDNAQLTFASNLEVWLRECSIEYNPRNLDRILHYMKSVWARFTGITPTVKQLSQLGWVETEATYAIRDGKEHRSDFMRGFALGDRILWEKKASTPLATPDTLKHIVRMFTARGDMAKWRKSIECFDTPNFAWAQAVLAITCGSVMAKWLTGNEGVALTFIYGRDSGLGKTTAVMMALAMYGDPKLQLVAKDTSIGTRISMVACAQNLPTIHDELTSIPLQQVKSLLFTLSANMERVRAVGSGAFSESSGRTWHSAAFATSNDKLTALLLNESEQVRPLLARVIQIDLDHLPKPENSPEVKAVVDLHLEHYGVAGIQWLQYLLDDLDKHIARLREIYWEVCAEFNSTQYERIWMNTIALAKFGAEVGVKAGIHPYSWERIKPEINRWLVGMRGAVGQVAELHVDWFSILRTEISVGVIRCAHGRTLGPREIVQHVPTTEDVARFKPLARINVEEGELVVPAHVIRTILDRHKITYTEAIRSWKEAGLIKEHAYRRITSNTSHNITSTTDRVVVFYANESELHMENVDQFFYNQGDDSDYE